MVFAQGDAGAVGNTAHTDTINMVTGDYALIGGLTDWASHH